MTSFCKSCDSFSQSKCFIKYNIDNENISYSPISTVTTRVYSLRAMLWLSCLVHFNCYILRNWMELEPVANLLTFYACKYDSRVVPDWKIPHITTLDS